ncbi:MAG: hypothetical protein U0T83_04160 [Bacteriovoracaceae bacterium]
MVAPLGPHYIDFINSLVARMKAESGDLETALKLINENYKKTPQI